MLLFFALAVIIVSLTIEAVKLSNKLDEHCDQTIADENKKTTVAKFILLCFTYLLFATICTKISFKNGNFESNARMHQRYRLIFVGAFHLNYNSLIFQRRL